MLKKTKKHLICGGNKVWRGAKIKQIKCENLEMKNVRITSDLGQDIAS